MPGWVQNLGFEDVVLVKLDANFTFTVTGYSKIPYSEGDSIYVNLALQEDPFGTSYWEASSKDDIKSKTTIDYIFYGTIGGGIAITVVEAIKD